MPEMIETTEDLRRLVEEDFSWRPQTRLKLSPGLWEYEWGLLVVMMVQDTYNPDPRHLTKVVHRRSLRMTTLPIPEMEAIRVIRHELHGVDLHESDEWIRVRGEMLFNPHRRDQ